MIEFFKHLFGFCGDGHPNIVYLLGLTPFVFIIKTYFNLTISGVRKFLKRLH